MSKFTMAQRYQLVLSKLDVEDGGGYLATVPDLPGCMADGETIAEAAEEIRDAILAYLNALEADGIAFPEPTRNAIDTDVSGKFQVRIPKTLHARLKRIADDEGVSLNQIATVYLAEGAAKKVA